MTSVVMSAGHEDTAAPAAAAQGRPAAAISAGAAGAFPLDHMVRSELINQVWPDWLPIEYQILKIGHIQHYNLSLVAPKLELSMI